MNIAKASGVLVAVAGLAVLGVVYAPSIYGQSSNSGTSRSYMVLDGRGSELGIRVDDTGDGVRVGEVSPNGPAEKAGMKAGDIIVSFDGEKVRSSRQLSRLVRETAGGKAVTARVRRDGSEKDLQVTPAEGAGTFQWSGNWNDLNDRLRDLNDRFQTREFDHLRNFNFDFNFPEMLSGRRLGVATQDLTDQLAKYFGVDDGVLVTAVTDGSAAAKAGLKAGDVITSVDGHKVTSREDLVRDLRDGTSDNVSIGIVRDKKESTVKASVPTPSRNRSRGRL